MNKHIKMPKYGLQQDEGTLVRWLKQEGDAIAEGDILCELETDKAMFDFEATESGFLRKILCEEGQTVPVLSDIAIMTDSIDEPLETPDTTDTADTTSAEPPSPAAEPPASSATAVDSPANGTDASQIRRSPAARKLAEDLDIDLATVRGTGPNGRITKSDVQAAADALVSTAAPAVDREPLSRMRKAIGKAMVSAKQTIPHFYLSIDIDATDLESASKSAAENERPGLTLTDLIVKAAADALTEYPILNARLENDDIVYNEHIHVGLAVGTEDGLLVPVIDAVDTRSLTQITETRSRLVTAARQGKLASDTQATVTLSNLGMFGIREFSAIINPPECAALAVGTLRDEIKPSTDPVGLLARRIMTITLSADHRLVDGLVCARYLQDLKAKLEDTSWL
jgi:pyruvate dehydrogenase E2 component (dihydrolipoamide acetyltransferase)